MAVLNDFAGIQHSDEFQKIKGEENVDQSQRAQIVMQEEFFRLAPSRSMTYRRSSPPRSTPAHFAPGPIWQGSRGASSSPPKMQPEPNVARASVSAAIQCFFILKPRQMKESEPSPRVDKALSMWGVLLPHTRRHGAPVIIPGGVFSETRAIIGESLHSSKRMYRTLISRAASKCRVKRALWPSSALLWLIHHWRRAPATSPMA